MTDQKIMLYSASHKTMEYTIREEDPSGISSLTNHYVGVFNPETRGLDLYKARNMAVRGGVRAQAVQAGEGRSETRVSVMIAPRWQARTNMCAAGSHTAPKKPWRGIRNEEGKEGPAGHQPKRHLYRPSRS
jgi:hypothetical protein